MASTHKTQPMRKQSLDLETSSFLLTQTITKIQQLPEPMMKELNEFLDFMIIRQDLKRWQQWNHFYESLELSESDFSDYLANLESYEESLARGEIQW
jgi:hypothetical protein